MQTIFESIIRYNPEPNVTPEPADEHEIIVSRRVENQQSKDPNPNQTQTIMSCLQFEESIQDEGESTTSRCDRTKHNIVSGCAGTRVAAEL
jgi:hypothetical protein